MALTLLLLSDGYQDVRDLLPELPMTPFALRRAPLKSTVPQEASFALHPDLLLIDGTGDADAAEEATRTMALAWEIGLPPLIVVVDTATLSRFRFETGADDFLLTTASSDEIAARFALAARRAGQGDAPTVLKVGDLTVNPENYQVYIHGKPLDLTYKEFELLRFLAQRPGRVCDRELSSERFGVTTTTGVLAPWTYTCGGAREARARARGIDRDHPQRRLSAGPLSHGRDRWSHRWSILSFRLPRMALALPAVLGALLLFELLEIHLAQAGRKK